MFYMMSLVALLIPMLPETFLNLFLLLLLTLSSTNLTSTHSFTTLLIESVLNSMNSLEKISLFYFNQSRTSYFEDIVLDSIRSPCKLNANRTNVIFVNNLTESHKKPKCTKLKHLNLNIRR